MNIDDNCNENINTLNLSWGFSYKDLHTVVGLRSLDYKFFSYLKENNMQYYSYLEAYRKNPESFSKNEYSELIIAVAPWLESFLFRLFSIDLEKLHKKYLKVERCCFFRTNFVEKASKIRYKVSSDLEEYDQLNSWLEDQLRRGFSEEELTEYAYKSVQNNNTKHILRILDWCYYTLGDKSKENKFLAWHSFFYPKKISYFAFDFDYNTDGCQIEMKEIDNYNRDDFSLIPTQMDVSEAAIQSEYCLFCHEKEIDYCRSGFYLQKSNPEKGYKEHVDGQVLSGCPLDEKISQMHMLKRQGFHLAALVAVMIDNPMCPATGHRICNDCMRSCIYQKQDPVDTPQVETRVLQDVLDLPWGVELYDLLVKWNPLRAKQYLPLESNNKKVLVAGLGPSGFTLLHHLWMEGVTVVGIDGVQLADWPFGDVMSPIYDVNSLKQDLALRKSLGFGGVSEYGITVRWDKNFLNLINLSLLRRKRMSMIGNVRFGGTITLENAWQMGFDHVALAMGAGLPFALDIENSLAKGMHQASDFLMELQLTGAGSKSIISSMEMQLPCVVIGGGLTAVDAATEAQAYYCYFVKTVYLRVDSLLRKMSEDSLWSSFSEKEKSKIKVWAEHGEKIYATRRAKKDDTSLDFYSLISSWGGVSVVYRQDLKKAPCYRQNPHELEYSLRQGINFYVNTTVAAVDVDIDNYVDMLHCIEPWQGPSCFEDLIVKNILAQNGSSWQVFCENDLSMWAIGMVICVTSCSKEVMPRDIFWKVVSIDYELGVLNVIVWKGENRQVDLMQYFSEGLLLFSGPFRTISMLCKTLLVANGSKPNVAYEYEHRGTFLKKGAYYKLHELKENTKNLVLKESSLMVSSVDKVKGFFTSYKKDLKLVSVLGDLHPQFQGSVVKAIASSMIAYPKIMKALSFLPEVEGALGNDDFIYDIKNSLMAKIVGKTCLPLGYYRFDIKYRHGCLQAKIGNIFRLNRMSVDENVSCYDPVCLSVASIDKLSSTISFVFKACDSSSRFLSKANIGENISCMGPSGVRLGRVDKHEKVVIIACGKGLVQACSYAKEYMENGNSILLLLSDKLRNLWPIIEEFSDLNPIFINLEGSNNNFNILCSSDIRSYLLLANRFILQGKGDFVANLYRWLLQNITTESGINQRFIGGVFGPMQCMLKGICAKCLQWQVDPSTGRRTKAVYSCSWQDQPLEIVDIEHMVSRQDENKAYEKLNTIWMENSNSNF